MTDTSSDECPNCGEEADYVTDTKPFERHYIYCNHCGLTVSPKLTYIRSLKELNEIRKDLEDDDFPPLKKLPKQKNYEEIFE